MRVPSYEERVPVQGTGTPTPELTPAPSAAAGLDVARATGRLGQTIAGIGERMGELMLQKKRLDNEQHAQDVARSYAEKMQDAFRGEGGYLTRQGNAAKGVLDEFLDQDEKLAAKLGEGLDGDLATRVKDLLDAHRLAYREAAISHETEQAEVGRKQTEAAALDGYESSAAVAPDPETWMAASTRAQEVAQGALERSGIRPDTEDGKRVLEQKRRDLYGSLVKSYVAANLENHPERVEKLLSTVGELLHPDERAAFEQQVQGYKMHAVGMAYFAQFSADPAMQNADGSISQAKVAEWASGLEQYTPDQQAEITKVVKEQSDQRARLIKDRNDSEDAAFFSEVSKPGFDVHKANKLAQEKAHLLASGRTDFKDVRDKLEYVRLMNEKGVEEGDNAAFLGLLADVESGNTDLAPVNKALSDGKITRGDANRLRTKVATGDTAAMKTAWDQIEAALKAAVPDPNSSRALLASLHRQALDKKITDPVELQKLYDGNMKVVPTGEPGFFRIFGPKTDEFYKSAETVQKNPELVRALGGTEQAVEFAKRMGGPAQFAPDTPESLVVLGMLRRGWKPSQITPERLKQQLEKNRDAITAP